MSDEEYLAIKFRENTGKMLDLAAPETFQMKLQWLKIHDRKPLYTTLVDKYAVKQYVADRIGREHVIPLIGGPWDRAEDIDFDSLPEQFVLKCSHDSGSHQICTDKKRFDRRRAQRELNTALRFNHYYLGREWAYKNVKPCIFAEQYMTDESGFELKDYKVFCFKGEPKLIQVDYGRFSEHKRNLYSTDWDYLAGVHCLYPTDPAVVIRRPDKLDQMLDAARRLSKNIPFVRVDLYSATDQWFFGEMTFYPGDGMEIFVPDEWNYRVGSWIDLSKVDGV